MPTAQIAGPVIALCDLRAEIRLLHSTFQQALTFIICSSATGAAFFSLEVGTALCSSPFGVLPITLPLPSLSLVSVALIVPSIALALLGKVSITIAFAPLRSGLILAQPLAFTRAHLTAAILKLLAADQARFLQNDQLQKGDSECDFKTRRGIAAMTCEPSGGSTFGALPLPLLRFRWSGAFFLPGVSCVEPSGGVP